MDKVEIITGNSRAEMVVSVQNVVENSHDSLALALKTSPCLLFWPICAIAFSKHACDHQHLIYVD